MVFLLTLFFLKKEYMKVKQYKVVLIGNSSVGKTSLVNRIIYKRMLDITNPTIGASFMAHTLLTNKNEKIRLNIWDTAGQERYRSMVSLYYRDVDICMLIFDISNFSVKDIEYWIKEYTQTSNKKAKIILVGNKADLLQNNIDYYTDAGLNILIEKYNLKFFITSVITGQNIDNILNYMGEYLSNDNISNQLNIQSDNTDIKITDINLEESKTTEKKYCCY